MLLLKPYRFLVALLVLLTIAGNGLNLVVPKLISKAIDTYTQGRFALHTVILQFVAVAVLVFILSYQTGRRNAWARICERVDAVKTFVSQAIASIVSSLLLIFGASALLLWINWRLALAILGVVPFIFITFQLVLRKVRKLFQKGQEAIDWLNRIVNESIRGASRIRLLNTQQIESQKFLQANAEARDIGLSVLRLFASLIPSITLATNVATVMILMLGGHYVIAGSMSLGNFTAFKQYLAILIFPIILIGFMSKVIAQASASYIRIKSVLEAPEEQNICGIVAELRGDIAVENVSLVFGEKTVLKDVSFAVPAGTKTAIIGPTAAGKTQLLRLLIGLLKPSSGVVACDGDSYDKSRCTARLASFFKIAYFSI